MPFLLYDFCRPWQHGHHQSNRRIALAVYIIYNHRIGWHHDALVIASRVEIEYHRVFTTHYR